MKFRSILAAVLLVGMTLSCKKSADPAANTSCTQQNLTDKVTAYSAAADAWNKSPTNANCKMLVGAYDNYIAVAQSCSLVRQADLASIQQARAGWASLCQ